MTSFSIVVLVDTKIWVYFGILQYKVLNFLSFYCFNASGVSTLCGSCGFNSVARNAEGIETKETIETAERLKPSYSTTTRFTAPSSF